MPWVCGKKLARPNAEALSGQVVALKQAPPWSRNTTTLGDAVLVFSARPVVEPSRQRASGNAIQLHCRSAFVVSGIPSGAGGPASPYA